LFLTNILGPKKPSKKNYFKNKGKALHTQKAVKGVQEEEEENETIH
jgi:hypothetical protein